MPKTLIILSITFVIAISACSSKQHLPTPSPAIATSAIVATEPLPSLANSPTSVPTITALPAVPAPAGLRVVYLRDGNLWSWTGAQEHVLLTDTGDLTAVRLSADGQVLAFMRGSEVWTVRVDGTDARPLVSQEKAGGALSFSPDGHFLAVSTADHIDVINLENATTSTVLTYSGLPESYYPEVVWSADSTGFKTIIPPGAETGQAEFLFVFADGKKASLAKGEMVAPSESPALISPDGGYVIFVEKLKDGQEALFLMDSSGAARPYGEPAENVRVFGWLPDSKHFVYANAGENQVMLGDTREGSPIELDIPAYESTAWLDAERFLAIQADNLYISDINGGEILVAEGVLGFDFVK